MSERWSAKGGRAYPARRGDPPGMEFFAGPAAAAGSARFTLALDDLAIELHGLDGPLAAALAARYGPYAVAPPSGAPSLSVSLSRDPREYFIEPPQGPEFNPVWIACDGTRIRYLAYTIAGWFDTREGRGQILLARGDYEPEIRALENYVRCAVAWCAAERGGALVHGASAVRNGRAYLFFGESGAGKSTLSAATRRARVVSDDLTLVLPASGGGLDVVGSPFRGTYKGGDPVSGRFPLAAAFRIVKAREASVEPAARAVVFGQLVGNLTFVAEAFATRPDLFASMERAFQPVPLAHLRFRKDDSYWEAIDAAGL
ncbi:MAG TPA: hypothetical protein VMR65_00705 [Candidatus Sulfotelmatobacter sp.]|nr:hypothetical protein [Candidatus Sulfotelmatobacter sp.]